MVSKRTIQRRRNSKGQKRRSLKRRNVKSRKVMRGGADDPLENVKTNDLVSVVLKDNAHPRGSDGVNADITVKCRVLSVDEKSIPLGKGKTEVVKVVTLQLTDNDYTFCYVYGGNIYDGIPTEFQTEFEISYIPSDDGMYPYKLIIFKRNKEKELEVIPRRYYTNIKKTGHEQYQYAGYVIKSVTPLTASQ